MLIHTFTAKPGSQSKKKKIMELPNDNLKPKYYKHFYINQVNYTFVLINTRMNYYTFLY